MKDKVCHNDYLCHKIGEKRQNILNEIKMKLDALDDRPCLVNNKQRKVPPMMEYPGYVNTRHPALQPPERTEPILPAVLSCHRDCQEYDYCTANVKPGNKDGIYDDTYGERNMVSNNDNPCTKYGMTSPGAHFLKRNLSNELRGGTFYNCCDCMKRNGLQDQCPRRPCGPKPKCLAYNPGPCCAPAVARRKFERD